MLFDNLYLSIDLEKTGRHLEGLIKQSEYSVKDIQRILHLSCPQPIYRWMKGQMLPSVDHLYVLARVLRVHMEELLVPEYETLGEYTYLLDWNVVSRGIFFYIDRKACRWEQA